MELKIRGNLTLGKLKIQPVTLSMENVLNSGFGGKITHNYPIPCNRCKGTIFHVCLDGDDWVSFCGNETCLRSDSDASKAIARDEYAKKIERNENGQLMTGAEKFRMGSSYKHACLAKWLAPSQLQGIVNSWTKDYKPFLVVMGNPGTGKTYLSASILNLLFERKEDVFYTTHRRFIEEIHRAIESGKTQHSVVEKFADKKFLILDDLGSATCSDWQQEMILELIDRRYADKSKTLITTNLNNNDLKEVLGERTASRILDQRNALVNCWTTDKRQDPEFKDYE
jgi:DNA replication protein DnaC